MIFCFIFKTCNYLLFDNSKESLMFFIATLLHLTIFAAYLTHKIIKMKNLLKLLVVPMLTAFLLTSCDKDEVLGDVDAPHEHELMTTLIYTLSHENHEDVVFTFTDMDGEGPMDPVKTQTGTLYANKSYTGSVIILNEAEHEEHEGDDHEGDDHEGDDHEGDDHEGDDHEGDMTDDEYNVTLEIIREKNEHQFFYTDVEGATIAYADKDDNNKEFGLNTTFVTGDEGAAKFTITLIHEPNKDGEGVADMDLTNAGGATDIETPFTTTVVLGSK